MIATDDVQSYVQKKDNSSLGTPVFQMDWHIYALVTAIKIFVDFFKSTKFFPPIY